MYLLLATVFFFACLSALATLIILLSNWALDWPRRNRRVQRFWKRFGMRIKLGGIVFGLSYGAFIAFFCGPSNADRYPPAETSPYRLPWEAGLEHFVSQGNRSAVSHRGRHHYAWDFWMAIGTPIMAARTGVVSEVVDENHGIGLTSNWIRIVHKDDSTAVYAHIEQASSVVRVGDSVVQGQLIAKSGMVGQTLNPHLHFVVFNAEDTKSMPISFRDVSGGVPRTGRSYTAAAN